MVAIRHDLVLLITYFAQSLGILGIESRLYYNIEAYILFVCVYIKAKQTNLL